MRIRDFRKPEHVQKALLNPQISTLWIDIEMHALKGLNPPYALKDIKQALKSELKSEKAMQSIFKDDEEEWEAHRFIIYYDLTEKEEQCSTR